MNVRGEVCATPAEAPELELDEAFWEKARIVETRSPRKASVHLRIDPETLDYSRTGGRGHLTRMAKVLKAYAETYQAGPHWLFLTGKKDVIYSLARDGFKLPIAPATAGGEPIVHSTRLVLVDKKGVVRGFYDGAADFAQQQLVSDIRRLLEEK